MVKVVVDATDSIMASRVAHTTVVVTVVYAVRCTITVEIVNVIVVEIVRTGALGVDARKQE
jgi:hypothetical protein